MPPSLALPPAIQKMSGKQTSARAAASALVALESLTKRTLPMRPTSSMRCARPGKLGDRFGDGAGVSGKGLGRGIGERCVLPIVRAGQMRGSGHIHHLGGARALRVIERAVDHKDAAAQHLADRDRHRGGAAIRAAMRVKIAVVRIVDADDVEPALRSLLQQARLHGGVVLQGAVAVDMIGRDVERTDIGNQTGRKIDLIGRDLQHIDRLSARRRKLEHRLADIAADLRRRSRRRSGCARSARSSSICRWCR